MQRACVWCTVPMALLFFAGLLVAGWLPPPHPDDTAAETARHYADHRDGIRVGALMIMCAGTLMVPITAAIATQMRRTESPHHPLAYAQLAAGAVVAVGFIVPTFFWIAAAFYSDTDPDTIRVLNAAGWLPMMGAVFPAILQNLTLAGVVFTDRRAEPVFPRWLGYFNVWVSAMFVSPVLVVFFDHGPFAWNGLLVFWTAAPSFAVWLTVMTIVLLRAIAQQDREALTA